MRGVKYIAPFYDFSGYGEASRNYILALHRAGVPLTIEARRFDVNPPDIASAEERAILQSLEGKKIDFDIVVVHLTPDLAPAYVDQYPDKYVISYTVWETSLLHPKWVDACNRVKEVWLPCQWNIDCFKQSGVNVPMCKVPHGISATMFDNVDTSKFKLDGIDKTSTFVFYSIFQWNARKNPVGLIRSYFNAFSKEDDVVLVLKTYIGGGLPTETEQRQIKDQVLRLKQDMGLPYYPRLYLIVDKLSTEQMKCLHLYGDAYVSLHHGEGWGLGAFEAGLAGKPVVATGATGNMEYMDDSNSYPVGYQWDYVQAMSGFNPWYLGNQQWACPNLIDASSKLRYVHSNYGAAKEKAVLLQQRIKNEFDWSKVVEPMINRFTEI